MVISVYSAKTRLAYCDMTLFRANGDAWQRSDFRLTQKYHPEAEVRGALKAAGFTVELHDAKDLGMKGDIGFGRTFYLGIKDNAD